MQICFDIVAPPSACHNKLAMRLAVSPRGMLALLLATVIAGALLVCSTVVQSKVSNIQTFIGPNGTEYVALQWATQLQWQPPPGPVMPPDDFGVISTIGQVGLHGLMPVLMPMTSDGVGQLWTNLDDFG